MEHILKTMNAQPAIIAIGRVHSIELQFIKTLKASQNRKFMKYETTSKPSGNNILEKVQSKGKSRFNVGKYIFFVFWRGFNSISSFLHELFTATPACTSALS